MWIVYVLQHDITKELYFGCTNNLKKRLAFHNNAKHAGYTKRNQGKWIVVYAEAYRDKHDAFVRESRLKQNGNTKRELKIRIKGSLF